MASVVRGGPMAYRECNGLRDGWQCPAGMDVDKWVVQMQPMVSPSAEQAIFALAGSGRWFTARDVMDEAGCSDTAVWKHVTRLIAEGVLERRKIVPPGKRSVVCEYRLAEGGCR